VFKTINPGSWLLLLTTAICLSTIYILPCIVIIGKRYNKRRVTKEEDEGVKVTNAHEVTIDEEDETTATQVKAPSPKSAISGVESSIIAIIPFCPMVY